MNLVISLATRNRPQLMLETISKSIVHWTNPETRLIIQADADDYATLGMLTSVTFDPRISVNMQKREDTVAAKWNRARSVPADVYLIMADDDPHVTPGYDQKILDAAALFPDGIGMVYGHPANASFSSIMAVTAKWADALGYILPEHFPYWFSDHWIDDIGRITGRIAFADVRSDQSKVGVTQEMREPDWWATWFDAAYLMRRQEAAKIIDAIDEPDWRKTMLRAHHPMIEVRSHWINDNVRASAKALTSALNLGVADERYQRIKKKALEMLPQILNGLPPEEARRYYAALVPQNVIAALPQAYPEQKVA